MLAVIRQNTCLLIAAPPSGQTTQNVCFLKIRSPSLCFYFVLIHLSVGDGWKARQSASRKLHCWDINSLPAVASLLISTSCDGQTNLKIKHPYRYRCEAWSVDNLCQFWKRLENNCGLYKFSIHFHEICRKSKMADSAWCKEYNSTSFVRIWHTVQRFWA